MMAKWKCYACGEAENCDMRCTLETSTADTPEFCPVSGDECKEWCMNPQDDFKIEQELESEMVICNMRHVCKEKKCGARKPHKKTDCEPCPFNSLAKCIPAEKAIKRLPTYEEDTDCQKPISDFRLRVGNLFMDCNADINRDGEISEEHNKEIWRLLEEASARFDTIEQKPDASAEKRTIAIRIRRNIAEKKVQWLTEENNTKENEIRILKEKIEVYERFKGKTNAELAIKLDAAEEENQRLREENEIVTNVNKMNYALYKNRDEKCEVQADQISRLQHQNKNLQDTIFIYENKTKKIEQALGKEAQ